MHSSRSRVLVVALVLAVAGLGARATTAAPDTTPPDTIINDYDVAYDHASFWFSSPDDATATFQCSLDDAKFAACKSPAAYTALAPGTHTFQVAAVDASGNVDPSPANMSWTASAPPPPPVQTPPNDGFYGAQVISGVDGSVDGSNVNATAEWNEPYTPVRGGASVWYLWTAPRSGSITFAAAGSGFAAAVSIFEGDSPDRVVLWSSGEGGATFNAAQNVTYRIAVDGVGGGTGLFTLSWAFAPTGAAANDYFADAQTIDGASGSVAGTTVGATAEPGEPIHSGTSCCDNSNEHSIWYRWTSPVTGTAFFTTEGSGYDTVLRGYTGTSVDRLVSQDVYWNDANPWTTWSRVELRVTAGTTYYVAVDAANGETGSVRLNWRTVAADPSDVVQPTVDPLSPSPGATVQGKIAFTADASDDVAVDRVVYRIGPNGSGDQWWVGEAYAPPYEVDLDTAVLQHGLYSVFVNAYDTAGNSSTSWSYTITVGATSPPTLNVPKSIVREAAGPGGVRVKYSATAQDYKGVTLAVTCKPASGSLFPLGTTKVVCSTTDSYGNRVSKTFTITVVDTTPPAITVPADFAVNAVSPAGAPVEFTATATDVVSGELTPTCTYASGDTFAIGDTVVMCNASDAAGNGASASFTVHVKGASEQLADTRAYLASLALADNVASKLDGQLADVAKQLAVPRLQAVCGGLADFEAEVSRESGKSIPADQADVLIADAQRIATVAGC